MITIEKLRPSGARAWAAGLAVAGAVLLVGAANPGGVNDLASAKALAPEARGLILAEAKTGGGSRLARVEWTGDVKELSAGFVEAREPDLSLDGLRVIFAGKRAAADLYQIYEMSVDGGPARQITHAAADCRMPVYQSRIFSLDIPDPWFQVAYVSQGGLRTAKLDGSEDHQIAWTPVEPKNPAMTAEGRMIFSLAGRLFGVNLDGTDYALFAESGRQPASVGRNVVFLEGQGQIATVSLDRPLHSKKTVAADPGWTALAALGEESLLAAKGSALWRMGLDGKDRFLVYQSANRLEAARVIVERPEPDGRGSVVDENYPAAKLYCQSVFTSDQPKLLAGAKKLRVLGGSAAKPVKLGELDLAKDGSFHLQLEANRPVRLEVLDAVGKVLRASPWIYARNKENRGCVGCHEDPELSPENREALAVIQKAVNLMPNKEIPAGGEKH